MMMTTGMSEENRGEDDSDRYIPFAHRFHSSSEAQSASVKEESDNKSDDQKTDDTILGTDADLMTDMDFPPEDELSLTPPIISESIRFLRWAGNTPCADFSFFFNFGGFSENCMKTEGIFRICGVPDEIATILQIFESGNSANFEGVSFHSIAGALKQYLRSLPDPLLTFEVL